MIRWTARYLSGDRTLLQPLVAAADLRENTTTLVTSTIVSKGVITTPHVLGLHTKMAKQHTDAIQIQLDLRQADPKVTEATSRKRPAAEIEALEDKLVASGICRHADLRVFESRVHKKRRGTQVYSEFIQQTADVDRAWEPEPRELKSGSVYFVRLLGSPFVKVGLTGQPMYVRLGQLQTANPHKLQTEFQFLTPHCSRFETSLHAYLKKHDKHVRGEWFRLPPGTDYFKLVMKACCL